MEQRERAKQEQTEEWRRQWDRERGWRKEERWRDGFHRQMKEDKDEVKKKERERQKVMDLSKNTIKPAVLYLSF